MATTVGQRKLALPEAELLADLFGISHDLQSTQDFCERLRVAWDSRPIDPNLIDALSTASIVRYCRCFEGGLRAKLDRDSAGAIDARFTEFHDYVFSLRQKHISHSVNEFEENHVTVAVVEPPAPRKVENINLVGGRIAGLDQPTAVHLKELAGKLKTAVDIRIEEERVKLKAIVDKLPVDEIYRLPEPPVFQPDWRRAGVKRGAK
jgi:hypothetical protein